MLRIKLDAALGPAKWKVGEGRLPRHPSGECSHFVDIHRLVESEAAFERSENVIVLNTVGSKHLHPTVVHDGWKIHLNLIHGLFDDTGFGGRNVQITGAILDDRMGRVDAAMEAFRDLLQFSLDAGDANFIYSIAVYMTEVVLHTGTNLEEAESALDAILSMELHYAGTVLPLCRQSQIHTMQGRLEEANKRLNEAHTVAKELDWAIDKVWLAEAEASLAVAEGHWEKALGAFEEVGTLHTQHGMRWDRAYHRALWADALGQSNIDGWLPKAKNLLAQSEAEFREIDAEFYADWANGKWAALETIDR